MRTHVLALLAALLLLLAMGAGTAAAGEPTQAVGQEAASQQSASANADATQVAPSNRNVDVRIFSPGDGGDVSQTNAAGALAVAGNANQTSQSASQDQSGAGTQAAGQDAGNDQAATANAGATQVKPSNENISVRIHSPGDDGDVKQTNVADAGAAAGNANATEQSAAQEQAGGDCKCHGGGGEQAVGQSADSKQSAEANADATQVKPSNENISVRIHSPGDGGDVKQTNVAGAGAAAGNANDTTQSATQSAGGGDGCKCSGGGVQAVGQKAGNEQSATSDASARQYKPSNDNTSVRIHSPGDDGDVTQANVAGALGIAFNENATEQTADQTQAGGDCKCHGAGVQAIGQLAYNDQSADANAEAVQVKPSNTNAPVRIGSPGDGGSVTQVNAAHAGALAGNQNTTTQSATQWQAGGGGVQAVGQKAGSKQHADADATAFQFKPANLNAPVSIGGGHDKKSSCRCDGGSTGGDVKQANVAGALGIAFNENATEQSVDQAQRGGDCKCHGGGVQAAGQLAWNQQRADASATANQLWAANENSPVRIGSAGGGGAVRQLNAAFALALAGNLNRTNQEVTQTQ